MTDASSKWPQQHGEFIGSNNRKDQGLVLTSDIAGSISSNCYGDPNSLHLLALHFSELASPSTVFTLLILCSNRGGHWQLQAKVSSVLTISSGVRAFPFLSRNKDADWPRLGHVPYHGPITVFKVRGLLLASPSHMTNLWAGGGPVIELCLPDDGSLSE